LSSINLINTFFKYSILTSGGVPVAGAFLGILSDILAEGGEDSDDPR
jgi:hypothetical protein